MGRAPGKLDRFRSMAHPRLQSLVVLLCVFLVLFVGSVQFLHVHHGDLSSDLTPDQGACSLCVVSHLAVTPAPLVCLPVVADQIRALEPPRPRHAPHVDLEPLHTIRPPPALNVFAA